MHCKGFLLSLLLLPLYNIVAAQDIAATVPTRISGYDTIALPKDYKPHNPEIAALIAANNPVKEKKTAPRKPVPKAGQKEYFGDMNEYVNNFTRKYLQAHNKSLAIVQDRSSSEFPLMENVLKQHDIPKELKYLAVIESALNNRAVSRVGATGPWQLMDATARLMGLTVNRKHDERTDWYKSTNGAAKYLSQLYDKLNDWLLVVAAYNSGPGPVVRAIERTGSNDFWEIKKYLPRETQGHVLAFIATTSIFENLKDLIGETIPEDFDITGKNLKPKNAVTPKTKPRFTPEELSNMAVVRIKEPISLDFMATELGMDKKLLDKWNDDYELFLLGTYPNEVYNLRIPKDKLENFLEKKSFLTMRSRKILDEMTM